MERYGNVYSKTVTKYLTKLNTIVMKRIIFTGILITLSLNSNAQISLGKDNVNGNSALLDFNDDPSNTKGIMLPVVTNAAAVTTPANGTFIYDRENKIVKMREKNVWVNLTGDVPGDASKALLNSSTEQEGAGVILGMGAETSSAKGVLVLESSDKAMILPKIASPHQNVKSPYPGMMCYDTVTKSLAVFDGSNWYFWR